MAAKDLFALLAFCHTRSVRLRWFTDFQDCLSVVHGNHPRRVMSSMLKGINLSTALGIPRYKLFITMPNDLIDTAVGAIQVAGQVSDFFVKANIASLNVIHYCFGLPAALQAHPPMQLLYKFVDLLSVERTITKDAGQSTEPPVDD